MRIFTIATMLVLVSCVSAEEKKLGGKWTKKAEGFELKFIFEKNDMMKFSMGDGTNGCTLEAKYKLEKDGLVKCEVTKYEKMGNFPKEVEKGYQFSFKIKVEGKKAKISDIEGKDIDDAGKTIIEGAYEQDAN